MWVRGLKHVKYYRLLNNLQSHPMWVRGLKPQQLRAQINATLVAPYVGAWIETAGHHPYIIANEGRTLCGCVD